MSSEMETLEEEKQGDLTNVEDKCEAKEEDKAEKDKQLVSKHEDKVEEDEEACEAEGKGEKEDTAMADKEDSQKGELEENDEEDESTQSESGEGSKKAAKEPTTVEKAKSGSGSKDPVTPSERPTRERKMVERYTESSSKRGSASKPLSIEKGRGTQLKDIPNVAFKLSKRKPDDNLQTLHSILFGKRTKAHNLKKNLGMFSGYLWVDNEHEKQRAKVREKLDKCVKEKLLDFCDVLNIPTNKTTIKKEDLCAKLLEFLESPHATTENLLSDKEKKGNKRKGKAIGGKTTGSAHAVAETPAKKQQKNSRVGEKRKRSSRIEEEDKVEPLGNGDNAQDDDESDTPPVVESVQEESKSEPGEDESKNLMPTEKNSPKKNVKKGSIVETEGNSKSIKEDSPTKSAKSMKKSSKASSTKKHKVEEENEKDQNIEAKEKGSRRKQSSTKKPKVEDEIEKDQNLESKEKGSRKKQSSTKKPKVEDESEKDKSLSAKEKASSKKKSSTKKDEVEAERERDQSLSAKEKTSSKKQPGSSSTKVPRKDPEKGKKNKKADKEPSREEMHAVAEEILREVDFNTATLSDIVKQLGTHFGVDLTNRKAEVKAIIAEVISNMTDDDEDDESDGEDD